MLSPRNNLNEHASGAVAGGRTTACRQLQRHTCTAGPWQATPATGEFDLTLIAPSEISSRSRISESAA